MPGQQTVSHTDTHSGGLPIPATLPGNFFARLESSSVCVPPKQPSRTTRALNNELESELRA
jgi:hypothetical protein